MNRYLVCYDLQSRLPDPHTPFLRQAETHGWSRWMNMQSGAPLKLPNTTLVGNFPTIEAALAAFDQALAATTRLVHHSVVVTKRYVVPHEESGMLVSNEKKTDDTAHMLSAILRKM